MRRRDFINVVASLALPKLMLMPLAHAEGPLKRPLVVWLGALPAVATSSLGGASTAIRNVPDAARVRPAAPQARNSTVEKPGRDG